MSSYNKPITFLCLLMRLEIQMQQEECVFPVLTLFPPCCIPSPFLFLKQASHHRKVKKPCHLVVNSSYYATKNHRTGWKYCGGHYVRSCSFSQFKEKTGQNKISKYKESVIHFYQWCRDNKNKNGSEQERMKQADCTLFFFFFNSSDKLLTTGNVGNIVLWQCLTFAKHFYHQIHKLLSKIQT